MKQIVALLLRFVRRPFLDQYNFPERGPRFRRAERRFQRMLVGGFALVLLLMVGSGLLGLFAMRRLGQGTQQMSERYLVQTRLEDELQRQQGGLGILLYNLANAGADHAWQVRRSEASARRDSILGLVAEATRHDLPQQELDVWKAIGQTSHKLFSELDRLLADGRGNSDVLASLHREFIAETARLIDINYDDVADDRRDELEKDAGIINNSTTLLVISWGIAISCAILCVGGSLAVFHGLKKQAETLARLSVHTLAEQEDTARRFSQEMHDEFGQTLNAIESTLSSVQAKDSQHQDRVREAIALSKDAQALAREISQLLRPRILDDFGLDAGLRELAGGFSRRTGISVDYHGEFHGRLEPMVESHLFRIAQEALTNTARHTVATNVELSITQTGDLLRMRIADNGGGFSAQPGSNGLGLLGMRERAHSSGGRIEIRSDPGQGVEIVAEIPLTAKEVRTEETSAVLSVNEERA